MNVSQLEKMIIPNSIIGISYWDGLWKVHYKEAAFRQIFPVYEQCRATVDSDKLYYVAGSVECFCLIDAPKPGPGTLPDPNSDEADTRPVVW